MFPVVQMPQTTELVIYTVNKTFTGNIIYKNIIEIRKLLSLLKLVTLFLAESNFRTAFNQIFVLNFD